MRNTPMAASGHTETALAKTRAESKAAELQAQAEEEVGRLRALGWQQTDFARALKALLETRRDD